MSHAIESHHERSHFKADSDVHEIVKHGVEPRRTAAVTLGFWFACFLAALFAACVFVHMFSQTVELAASVRSLSASRACQRARSDECNQAPRTKVALVCSAGKRAWKHSGLRGSLGELSTALKLNPATVKDCATLIGAFL